MKFFLRASLLWATASAFTSPALSFLTSSTTTSSRSSSCLSSATDSSSTKVPFDFDPTSGPAPALIKNNADGVWVPQRSRPRRNRKSAAVRGMVRENIVTPNNFIYPLFIHSEDHQVAIESMPGCERHSLAHMLVEVGEAMQYGVNTFVLFPKVDDDLKTNYGVEAYNPNGIVPGAISMIKEKYPDATVVTDVALDPYSDQGHDGVVEDGKVREEKFGD